MPHLDCPDGAAGSCIGKMVAERAVWAKWIHIAAMPLTGRQETILQWLRRAYPNAADLFTSGLKVRADSEMPCRTRLMGHAFREMCIVITNQHSSNSRVKIDPLLDEMSDQYGKLNYDPMPLSQFEANAAPTTDVTAVQVPNSFMRCTAKVVDFHRSQVTGRDRTRKAFEAISGGDVGSKVDVTPTADRWHKMYDYFVGRAHDPDADNGGTDAAELDREVQFFEETLESLARPAISNLDDLDAILESANS